MPPRGRRKAARGLGAVSHRSTPGGEHQCPGEGIVGPLEGALTASMEGFWSRLDARLASLAPQVTGGRSGTREATPTSMDTPGSSGSGMDGTANMGSSASASSIGAPGSGKEKGG